VAIGAAKPGTAAGTTVTTIMIETAIETATGITIAIGISGV
jgi:hypothetical protein